MEEKRNTSPITGHITEMHRVLSSIYTRCYYVSLDRGSYRRISLESSDSRYAPEAGSFDELIDRTAEAMKDISWSIKYRSCFSLRSLRDAHEEGRNRIELWHPYTSGGKTVQVETIAVITRGDDDELCAILLSRVLEGTAETLNQTVAELQVKSSIVNVLAEEYGSVFYIDLTNDTVIPYRYSDEIHSRFAKYYSNHIVYSESFHFFVGDIVSPVDFERVVHFGSPNNLRKILKNKKEVSIEYSSSITGSVRYYEAKFIRTDDGKGFPTTIVLGIADRSERFKSELINRENLEIARALSESFESIYYVNIKDDSYHVFNTHTAFESLELQLRYSDFFADSLLNLRRVAYPDDIMTVTSFLDKNRLLNAIKKGVVISPAYRLMVSGRPVFCRMRVTSSPTNPDYIIVAVENVDEYVRSRKAQELQLERDKDVISGLADDFTYIAYFDIMTGVETFCRTEPLFSKNVPGWDTTASFPEHLDRIICSIVHPDDRNELRKAASLAAVRTALRRESVYYVNFRMLIKKKITYYQVKFVRPESIHGQFIVGFHDVDAETRREMKALKRAEDASLAKTNFLSNMSHDIRTPMNAIMGFMDIALSEKDNPEKMAECLEKAKLSGAYLLSIINDILDMSYIESGKLEITTIPADLNVAFSTIGPMLNALTSAKNLNLNYSQGPLRNPYVYIDITHLNQVLINIISNAIKYTDEGGTITVSFSQLPGRKRDTARFRFIVQDTGAGMSRDFLKHIFEAFSREKSSTMSKKQGTGLGLAIAKRITDLMNGTIEVESEPGKGSKFTLVLPFKICDDPDDIASITAAGASRQEKNSIGRMPYTGQDSRLSGTASGNAENSSALLGMRILVAEDNDMNREIIVTILEKLGTKPVAVVNGEEAVEQFRAHPHEFDAILMDIQMPVMNGYDATRAIRELCTDRHIPIVALSANAFNEDRLESLKVGMDYHLSKPIDVPELTRTLLKFASKQG